MGEYANETDLSCCGSVTNISKYMYKILIMTPLTKVPTWKSPTLKWINKTWYIHTEEYSTAKEKERTTTTLNSTIGGSHKQYIKQQQQKQLQKSRHERLHSLRFIYTHFQSKQTVLLDIEILVAQWRMVIEWMYKWGFWDVCTFLFSIWMIMTWVYSFCKIHRTERYDLCTYLMLTLHWKFYIPFDNGVCFLYTFTLKKLIQSVLKSYSRN